MLLNLIVSLVRIKLESNNFKLCSGNMLNFYFQKQYYGLLSLNNVHIGAKMNRDQTIIITIQKLLKIASGKKKKQYKAFTVDAAQARKRPSPLRARGAQAISPTNPAHPARPPGPHLARDAAKPSRPSDLIRRPAATLAGSKPATPALPRNPSDISPSPFSLHATQRQPRSGGDGHGGRGGEDNAAPSRLARRCARSPVGERAAVELAMDGALLSSPRACAPASRRRAAERPVPRPDEAGCAGLSRTRAAGCGAVQVSTHRPLL